MAGQFDMPARPVWPVVARGVAADSVAGLRTRLSDHGSKGGAQSDGRSCEEAVDYAMSGYAGLRDWLGPKRIEGSRILELGPGDNQALALCFLADGAARVIGLDRFRVIHDPKKQAQTYAMLLDRLGDAERAKLESVIDMHQNPPRFDSARVAMIAGVGVEDAVTRFEPESFDVIFSVAVGEHLYSSDLAFDAMDRLLAPGGTMLHQIDLRDHGIFTGHGLHPLTWLTVADWAYDRMVRHRGGPNRRLVDYYRRKLDGMGYEYTLPVSQVVGDTIGLNPYPPRLVEGEHYDTRHEALVGAIRGKLLKRFRSLPDEDLLTAGILLMAHKKTHAAEYPTP